MIFALFTACSENDESSIVRFKNAVQVEKSSATIATAADDYSSGAHSVITVNNKQIVNSIDSSGSDLLMTSFREHFYRIERFGANNITKYHVTSPDVATWKYSTQENDQQDQSNPSKIIFLNESKAYILRYGSFTAWIVNPSATEESNFKIGEIDLSAYKDQESAGMPEMINGVIADNKLYIVMQRLVDFAPDNSIPAYVAVFDTETDEEIDIQNDGNLKGIPLALKNPASIKYLPENNTLYIGAQGKKPFFDAAEYTGGIEAINLTDFTTTIILDDGDDTNHPYGLIDNIEILNDSLGYFVGYEDGIEDNLFSFNPSTGNVNLTPIIENKSLTTLRISPSKKELWVGNRTDHGITIVDIESNTLKHDLISTAPLNPISIEFVSLEN